MKTGFLVLVAAALLPAGAQPTLTLQMTNQNGSAFSYWPGTYGIPSVQSTLNLSRPIPWTDEPIEISNSGTATVTNAYRQQFFRFAPILPIFQFNVFYNVNLEVMGVAGLNFPGPVFCNQNIWAGATLCNFYSFVTAVGTNAVQTNDPFCDYLGSGPSAFLAAGQPVSHAAPLALMGFGTNISPATMRGLIELPPATCALGTPAAYSAAGLVYPANAADLVITNFASATNHGSAMPYGTNMFIYYQDSSLQQLSQVPFDLFLVTNRLTHSFSYSNYVSSDYYSNVYFAGYSFVTNSRFYDWREGYNNGAGPAKRVEAVDIDVNLLNKWLTNQSVTVSGYPYDQTKYAHSGHHIDSIYVYTSVPLTGTQLPAVRLKNGAQLPSPSGLTVVTPFPLYILGNYNVQTPAGSSLGLSGPTNSTQYTYPASVMADAITILSPSWSDGTASILPYVSINSTVNAAVLCGIVPSDPTKTGNQGMNGDYSGGVENSLRLLENWANDTLTYNGSIVVLFYSQYATNSWRQTGYYYTAPTRHWASDWNFQDLSKLPPLTPLVKNYESP